jgi:protein ImuB
MSRSLPSRDFALREAVTVPNLDREPARASPQSWIAVYLPNLAFDVFGSAVADEPAVVVEPLRGQIYVVAVNRFARRSGIVPGAKLSSAFALAASLRVFERSVRREQASLESLSAWAERLTSAVSPSPPDTVLLEVAGSVRLFGSLAAIKHKLDEEVARRRWARRLCAAPTATAALWLARGAVEDVESLATLSGRLGSLPIRVTRWPLGTQALLQDLGVRTIADCLRLPRDGFARRVGLEYLHDLDRALARRFDLHEPFVPRERWGTKRELYHETSDAAVFMAAVGDMLDALTVELRRRQAEVRSLRIAFEHVRREPTFESFDWAEPTHERNRLLSLLRDRLERIVLPAPAIALRLTTGFLLPLQPKADDLFDKTPVETLAHVLLERLRGRLGTDAVHGIVPVAEHRPEFAWSRSDARAATASSRADGPLSPWAAKRPLWLLPVPLPLGSTEAHRYYRGSVELGSSAERIESGWWDGRDACRDYYAASSSGGERLWIYRDRRSLDWHLHGLFG